MAQSSENSIPSLPYSFTLIIGEPRSGTTLISSCFMSHSTVYGVLEPYQQRRKEPYEVTDVGTFIKDYEINVERKPNFAIKETTTRLENVRLALLTAKNAQDQDIHTGLILVLRCPFECYLSQAEASQKFWKEKKLTKISEEAAVHYFLRRRAMLKELCHHAHRFHYRLVSYDAFCEHTEIELKRLMSLISTPLESHQLTPKQSKSTVGRGDPKFKSSKSIYKRNRKDGVAELQERFGALPVFQYAKQLSDLIKTDIYEMTNREKLNAITILTN